MYEGRVPYNIDYNGQARLVVTLPNLPHRSQVAVEIPAGDMTLLFESRYHVYRSGRIPLPKAVALILENWFGVVHGDKLYIRVWTA